MVTSIRLIEKALGSEEKKPVQSELETRRIARKSIVIKKDIAQGLKISKDLLMIKRPGTGIEPKHIDKVIGKRAKHELKKDEVLTWEMIE